MWVPKTLCRLILMRRLITIELGKLKLPVGITISVLALGAIILSCTLYTGYSLTYDLEAWEVGTAIISFLFPLFVVVPVCWTMYYERKDRFLIYTVPRVGKLRYLAAKWIAAAIAAFAIMFIPYLLSALAALYLKPPITPWPRDFSHAYLELYVSTPLLYAVLLSAWRGVLGVLVMSLGYVLSLYVGNVFVILTGPFIYTILENFIFAILLLPQFRLVTSFEPDSVSSELFTPWAPLVGPAVLILVTSALWLVFAKVRRLAIYEV